MMLGGLLVVLCGGRMMFGCCLGMFHGGVS
jgi:hypothetical protein